MPPPRVDQRDRAAQKHGKRTVNYPYGDINFPRIVEDYTTTKDSTTGARAPLSKYPDKLAFPNALLTSQVSDKGDDTTNDFTATYDTLPGPTMNSARQGDDGLPVGVAETLKVATTITPGETPVTNGQWSQTTKTKDPDNSLLATETVETRAVPGLWIPSDPENDPLDGVVLAVSRRIQDANLIQPGEGTVPASTAAVTISSITDGGAVTNGFLAIITTATNHGLSVNGWVQMLGTNSTPLMAVSVQVYSVTSATVFSVMLKSVVTVAGSSGTATPLWPRTTSEPYPNSTVVKWEVVKTRPLPGPNRPTTRRDEDGVVVDIETTVEKLPIATPETLTAGSWNRVNEEEVPGSSKIGISKSETRVVPGPWIVSEPENDPLDGAVLAVNKRVQDTNLIAPGEGVVPTSTAPINVTSITTAGVVTLASNHGLSAGQWIQFLGANSTPALGVSLQIIAVPAANQVTVSTVVTIAGTAAGTMTPLWPRYTSEAFPGTTIVRWEVVKTRVLPGPVRDDSKPERDGVRLDIATTLVEQSSIAPGESLVSNVWTTTDKETLSGSSKAAKQIVQTRAIPGLWISDVPEEDPLDGAILAVNRRLQDVNLINPGEGDVPASTAPISITAIATGANSIITLFADHGLVIGNWVQFMGTDSSPELPVSIQVIDTPASDQVTVAFNVTGAGTTGTMTPLWPRTTREEREGTVLVAWEVVKTRPLPGPTRDTSHPDEDGVWVDENKTVAAPGSFSDGEPDITGDNTSYRTSREAISGTSKIVFKTVASRAIPGLAQNSTKPDLDGVKFAIALTLAQPSDISPGDVLAANVWTVTDKEAISGYSKVAKQIVKVRSIPGPWITSEPENDPFDGGILAVNKRLQDANLINPGESPVPSSTAPINVVSIATGNPTCTVTVASAHGLSVGSWVQFLGTNSTPALGVSVYVLTVPTSTTFTVAVVVTNAGTMAGTMTPLWPRYTRETREDTVNVAWEIAKTKVLPGPAMIGKTRDPDGATITLTTTVKDRTTIVSQEAFSAPNWSDTDQEEISGSSKVAKESVKTRILPGPIVTERDVHEGLIDLLVSRQKVYSGILYQCGEIIPAAINVSSITTGSSVTVTLASDHGLPVGAWVRFVGTNSTPPLGSQTSGSLVVGAAYTITTFVAGDDFANAGAVNASGAIFTAANTTPTTWTNGSTVARAYQILGVPNTNQVLITPAATITGAGTAAGTFQAINRIVRQLKPTSIRAKASLIKVKVETMAAIPDVGVFNENIGCWKNYSFPNFRKALTFYKDYAFTSTVSATISHSYNWSGALGIAIQNGYRGPCVARRLRFFSVGPFLDAFIASLSPTIIIPSSGTSVIEGGTFARTIGSGGFTDSQSNNYRPGSIPAMLTGPPPTLITISTIGTGSPALVTTSSAHGFAVNDDVIFAGTNSTPLLDGTQRVYSVNSSTTFHVAPNGGVSGGGTGGTVSAAPYTIVDPSGGLGQARINIDMPTSVPTHFTKGDIITILDQPQRTGTAGIWELIGWQIVVPYTSGSTP